jgi:molybdate transport system substrate-binding protein
MKILILFALFCSAVEAKDIVVFAASSLTDVMTKIATDFEKEHKVKIKFSFDASSRLAFQIEQGAKADLFFSADKEWNNALAKKGFTSEAQTRDLLSNNLVVITHKNQKFIIKNLAALKDVQFKQLALAGDNVPAGKYSFESLMKSGVYEHVKPKVVSADNVRNVLAWVAKDEADLGIVFSTDAKSSSDVKVLLQVPTDYHSLVIYPVSLIGKNPDPDAAKFFVYLQTPKVKNIFIDFGFKSVGK